MTKHVRIADCQLTGEVVFWNVVEVSDHINSHPGANSVHIARFERVILLLETFHRPVCTDGSGAYNPQHEEQEQAEQAQLDTFTWRIQLLLTLSLASKKALKRYIE
ncbi:MAG: hypothetical protein ACRDIV_15480 [Ktedonobacteraceae bacterium]